MSKETTEAAQNGTPLSDIPTFEEGVTHVRERIEGTSKTRIVKVQPIRTFVQKGKPKIFKQHGFFYLAGGKPLSDEQLVKLDFDVAKEVYNPDPTAELAYLEARKANIVRRAKVLGSKRFD